MCYAIHCGRRVNLCEDPPEHLGWDGVHLVQHHDAPLLLLDPLHGLFSLPRPPLGVGDHVEGGDQDAAAHGLVLGVRGESI